ncbi:MAG: D-tyrosyl-tRNA(Tyr) deacylase [Crocinitomix sp.]|nr:D-tyrosyl-tRNA(Tyr) deacylase [Crocinitomix sp.]
MRVVLQRVSEAAVEIDGVVHGKIDLGLLILVGIETVDSLEDVNWLAKKIVDLRIFNDAENHMNLSVKEVQGDLLVISQFTLHAKTKKGNRPSFIDAARPEIAIPLYENFKNELAILMGHPVQSGVFGANMKISLVNDGPVTILIDSQNRG